MSGKRKTSARKDERVKPPAREGRAAMSAGEVPEDEDARAAAASAAWRTRREAVQGKPPIDRDIHWSLPLTRAFVPLIVLTLAAYGVSYLAARMGNAELYRTAGIASSMLLVVAAVVWFVSRHQAKKLTAQRDAEDDAAAR